MLNNLMFYVVNQDHSSKMSTVKTDFGEMTNPKSPMFSNYTFNISTTKAGTCFYVYMGKCKVSRLFSLNLICFLFC